MTAGHAAGQQPAQERERGITILAKNVAINYTDPRDGSVTKINLIDTPGHADFGGEVERVLNMADGVFLLVDAAEGPMPQTRFVLKKAFQHELRPIVVINKIDRPDAAGQRGPGHGLRPVRRARVRTTRRSTSRSCTPAAGPGRRRGAWSRRGRTSSPVFEALLKHVPAPHGDVGEAAADADRVSIQYSDYVGRIGVGRIYNGVIKTGQQVIVAKRDGARRSRPRSQQVHDLRRPGPEERRRRPRLATSSNLIGLESVDISDSICDPTNPIPLDFQDIEPPTLTMMFSVNTSPFVGKEGKYVTSRNLRERLMKELESNVALKVTETENRDAFKVSGRGLLHLGILIENMRREGYELSISKPNVITRKGADGTLEEPIEYLVVDVPESSQGAVMGLIGNRRGELVNQTNREGQIHLEFTIPARGLIGLRTRMLTATQGTAIMHHNFHEYAPVRGDIAGRSNGVMISNVTGKANSFSMNTLQDRGVMFVEPNAEVYEGMIVAENCRPDDIVVNPTKAKQLTNMRTTSSDENIILKPARQMTLEQALEYIEEDELVEVTPLNIRLRKESLTENERKKGSRKAKATAGV